MQATAGVERSERASTVQLVAVPMSRREPARMTNDSLFEMDEFPPRSKLHDKKLKEFYATLRF